MICKVGDPRLSQRSEEWSDFSDEGKLKLKSLLKTMKGVMRKEEGVGLAAVQIGVPVRIFIVESVGNRRYSGVADIPLSIFINPVILKTSKRTSYFVEGCLSVDGQRVGIIRPRSLWVSWQNEYGQRFRAKLRGFFARVFLHEYDHLEGKVILDYL